MPIVWNKVGTTFPVIWYKVSVFGTIIGITFPVVWNNISFCWNYILNDWASFIFWPIGPVLYFGRLGQLRGHAKKLLSYTSEGRENEKEV
jgi:hypothetical protein